MIRHLAVQGIIAAGQSRIVILVDDDQLRIILHETVDGSHGHDVFGIPVQLSRL